MRLREFFYLLGFKPQPRRYNFKLVRFSLPGDGTIDYAGWLHPDKAPTEITQQAVDELRKFLSPGDVAIDIGAHEGDSTVPIALAVGRTGCVLALEPNEYVFPILVENSKLNPDKTNIRPLMIAATDENREMVFEYGDPGYCNGGYHEGYAKYVHGSAFELKVQGRNLENLLKKDMV